MDSKVPFPSLSEEASVDLSVVVPAYNEEQRCMDVYLFFCFLASILLASFIYLP